MRGRVYERYFYDFFYESLFWFFFFWNRVTARVVSVLPKLISMAIEHPEFMSNLSPGNWEIIAVKSWKAAAYFPALTDCVDVLAGSVNRFSFWEQHLNL